MSSYRLVLPLLSLLLLVTATTIVKVTNVVAVKERLVHSLVDNVMGKTQPSSGRVTTAGLGRVLSQHFAEVRGALAAGVQPSEEVHEGVESESVVFRGVFGESCHHRVEELPGRSTEFSPT